jgi:hypothetical protein
MHDDSLPVVVAPENVISPAELRGSAWKVKLFGARSGSRLGGRVYRHNPPWLVQSVEGDEIFLVPVQSSASSGTLGVAGDSGALVVTDGHVPSKVVGLQSAVGSLDGRPATLVSLAAAWLSVRAGGGGGGGGVTAAAAAGGGAGAGAAATPSDVSAPVSGACAAPDSA